MEKNQQQNVTYIVSFVNLHTPEKHFFRAVRQKIILAGPDFNYLLDSLTKLQTCFNQFNFKWDNTKYKLVIIRDSKF